MAAKKHNFPLWLQGTPEQQEAEAKVQEMRRASFGRAHMTPAEQLVSRGALLEETARATLEVARGKNAEARELAENQLADALAMQGKYTEAAETHNDKHRRAYFRKVVQAIEKPDDEKCSCKDIVETVGETEIAITPRFELDRIFSPVHKDLVSVVACQKCSHMNARPIANRLLIAKGARNRNRAALTANTGRGFVNDKELFKTK